MHCFHLNESALSDKREVGLFKCKSSGMSIDTVRLYTKLKTSCHRWVGSVFWYFKELEDVSVVLHCIPLLFPHCHGECSDPSKLFRSNNGYSNNFVTILYIVITKAVLSSAFQFQSQCPSFICMTKTNGKHISARVRLIMVFVKVFLMIQFEAVISRGRKYHLLGIFYFSPFYEKHIRE